MYTYHVYTYYVDMTSYDYSVRSHSPGFSPVLWAPQVGRYPRCQVTLDHAVVGQKEPPQGKFWKFHMQKSGCVYIYIYMCRYMYVVI